MVPIKIECGCGQHYAFDIEPVQGLMPCNVCCPSCGMDGTDAANDYITKTTTPPMVVAAAAPVVARMRVSVPASTFALDAPSEAAVTPATSGRPSFKREINFEQVVHEARARTLWGDEPEEVVKFLMLQGLSAVEATELKNELFVERAKTVRSNGIFKAVTGFGLMCVPVATLIGCMAVGYIPLKLIGVTGVLGLWGFYRLLKGSIMFIAPKSEPGDVSDQ